MRRFSTVASRDGTRVYDPNTVSTIDPTRIYQVSKLTKLEGIHLATFADGTGLGNTFSLLELVDLIGRIHGEKPALQMETWRCADQRYFVSDTRKFKAATGWSPRVNARQGVERLYRWLQEYHAPAPPSALNAGEGAYALLSN